MLRGNSIPARRMAITTKGLIPPEESGLVSDSAGKALTPGTQRLHEQDLFGLWIWDPRARSVRSS